MVDNRNLAIVPKVFGIDVIQRGSNRPLIIFLSFRFIPQIGKLGVTERPSLTIHNEPPSSCQPKETLASDNSKKKQVAYVLCYVDLEIYTKSRSLI